MTSTHISSRTRATPRGHPAHRLLPCPFRPYTGVDSVQALLKNIHSPLSGRTPASTLFGHSAILTITGPMSHLLTLLLIDSEHADGIRMPFVRGLTDSKESTEHRLHPPRGCYTDHAAAVSPSFRRPLPFHGRSLRTSRTVASPSSLRLDSWKRDLSLASSHHHWPLTEARQAPW